MYDIVCQKAVKNPVTPNPKYDLPRLETKQLPVKLRVVLQSGFGPRLKYHALAKTHTTKKLMTKELIRASPDSIELYLLASLTAPLFFLFI